MARLELLHSADGIVVSCEDSVKVLRGAALLIRGDRIAGIGPSEQLLQRYLDQGAEKVGVETTFVDLTGRWVVPGLVNTHVHTSQQLGRGIADDVDLLTWLHDRIWPYESAMTEEDSYLSSLLCCVELIRSGVTCFGEAGGQHVAGMARAVEESGLRACLCRSTMDTGEGLPLNWANRSAAEEIAEQVDLYHRFHGTAEGRIRVWLGLRQILNSTDELLRSSEETARQLNTGIHMIKQCNARCPAYHEYKFGMVKSYSSTSVLAPEIPMENVHVRETRKLNGEEGTVTYLDRMGLLSKRFLAAHAVWLSDKEVGLMAQSGASAVHCPGSAMRMLGFSPVTQMLEAGVNVSLGTDGAPSNNRMSMVDEMYLAAMINKGKMAFSRGTTDPTALPAATVLRMATINGARTMLWEDEIGTLEEGKKADLVIVNPNNFAMTPMHNPVSSLVYSMRTENIESVMCNGKWLMYKGIILTLKEADIVARAQLAAKDLLKRAGIVVPVCAQFLDLSQGTSEGATTTEG